MSRGLVLGCGGPVGFAWTVGALIVAERELGWDARSADMIVGTSAGAELAAFLGSGIAAAELADGLLGDPALPVVAEHLTAGPGLLPPWPR
ncbi:patatin, partial [Kribbella sp. NPDC006257]